MNYLESANEKLEASIDEYKDAVLSRHESQALIQEYNEDQAAFKELYKKERRMEWPILLLVVILYYFVFHFFTTHAEASFLEWARREYSEIFSMRTEL